MNFKGFTYQGWEDYEDDNIKIFHDVQTPEGKVISMPFSPYFTMTQKAFEQWILIGCPTESRQVTRPDGGVTYCNWTPEYLQERFNQVF